MVSPYRWVIPLPVPRVLEVDCNRSSSPFSRVLTPLPLEVEEVPFVEVSPLLGTPLIPRAFEAGYKTEVCSKLVTTNSQKNQKKQVVCFLSFPGWCVVPTCLPSRCLVTQPKKIQKTFPLDPGCPYTLVQLQPRNSKQA